jgi:hypothetical protein
VASDFVVLDFEPVRALPVHFVVVFVAGFVAEEFDHFEPDFEQLVLVVVDGAKQQQQEPVAQNPAQNDQIPQQQIQQQIQPQNVQAAP